MDWICAAFMIPFVASLMMFLGELAVGLGFKAIAIALVCLASLLAFVVNESKNKTPLLDLAVFREKKFVLPIISITLLIISSLLKLRPLHPGSLLLPGSYGLHPSR